jgi:DNA-binding MarR family transcriptional regulator
MKRPASSPTAPPVFYRPDTLQPDESIGRLMRQIMSTMASQVDRELAPLGLTEAQWMPLLKLHLALASTSTELARECRTDAGATTRMIDRLEEKGFIQRTRSEQDRRVVNLELTAEGRGTAQHIPAVLCKVQNELLNGFTQAEFDTLKSLLRRMLANAKALASQERA